MDAEATHINAAGPCHTPGESPAVRKPRAGAGVDGSAGAEAAAPCRDGQQRTSTPIIPTVTRDRTARPLPVHPLEVRSRGAALPNSRLSRARPCRSSGPAGRARRNVKSWGRATRRRTTTPDRGDPGLIVLSILSGSFRGCRRCSPGSRRPSPSRSRPGCAGGCYAAPACAPNTSRLPRPPPTPCAPRSEPRYGS